MPGSNYLLRNFPTTPPEAAVRKLPTCSLHGMDGGGGAWIRSVRELCFLQWRKCVVAKSRWTDNHDESWSEPPEYTTLVLPFIQSRVAPARTLLEGHNIGSTPLIRRYKVRNANCLRGRKGENRMKSLFL